MLDQILDYIIPFVQHHGYWLVGAILLLENMGIPLPGELVLISSGLLAFEGHLNIWLIAMWAIIGAVVGDNCGYWLGKYYGARIINAYCRWFKVPREREERVQELFLRYSGWMVFLGRFVALLRMFAGPLAGVMGMSWKRFLVCNTAGAVIWVACILGGSYIFGAHVRDIVQTIGIWGMVAAIAAVFYIKLRVTQSLMK